MANNRKIVRSRTANSKARLSDSVVSVVDAAFKEDDGVRAALIRHIKPRAQESRHIAARASEAFKNFRPSVLTHAERRNYLPPGESLGRTMRTVVEKGIAAMRASAPRRALKIHVDGELKEIMTPASAGGREVGRFALGDLLPYLLRQLADSPTLRNDPVRTAHDAEAKADELVAKIEGKRTCGVPETPDPVPRITPGTADCNNVPRTEEFVGKHVEDLLAHVAPPEEQVRFNVQRRAKLPDTEKNVDTFQLRAGASDVTSYHDFRCLHIAFEHVWTELFDDRLKSLGTQLYNEAAKLESFLQPAATTNLNFSVSSIPDLLNLLRSIRALSNQAKDAMPASGAMNGFLGLLGLPFNTPMGDVNPKDTTSETTSDYVTIVTG